MLDFPNRPQQTLCHVYYDLYQDLDKSIEINMIFLYIESEDFEGVSSRWCCGIERFIFKDEDGTVETCCN